MGKLWRSSVLVVAVVLVTSVVGGGTASAVGVPQSSIPATVPTAQTPQVLDNAVQDLAQSGSRIIASGNFTQVRDATANGGTTFSQPYVFAFDNTTGAVDRGFRPTVNGVVNALLPGPNNTVYIGGSFSRVNGTAISNLAQLSLTTGRLTAFRPAALNGAVNDVLLAGTRLIVGGVFSTAGGAAHGGLASLNPTTGALDPYMTVNVLGHHNWDGTTNTAHGSTGVENIDLSPDGTRLVVIGNFTSADGLHRDQVMIVRLTATGASVDPNWETHAFEAGCYTFAFDYYVRALQFAPDGSYFVIATTGGNNPGTHCDTITRWDIGATGSDVQPRWSAYSGGDSSFAVAVTGTAVYAGGHSRWLNNENGGDSPGTGAVPRPSLSALDPRTGMPLAWNPGRHPRGVGVQAMLATSGGLYIGSDTDYIGNHQYLRPRLAYFPLAGGTTLAAENLRSLPANVFMAGRATATAGATVDAVVSRYFDGTTPGADATTPSGGVAWGQARGAFMINNTLFYGFPNPGANGDYYLYKRTFDGTTFGPATVLNPYSDPVWNTTSTGSRWTTEYYQGIPADLYGQELSTVTGIVYTGGFIYYTRAGSPTLYYRAFSPDSGVVEAREHVAASSGFGDVAGMFLSGGNLYWASAANGELRTTTFTNGVPGATSSLAAAGPATGGPDWRTRAMFAGPGGPAANTPPTAAFTSSCSGLGCSFDGTTSSDNGSISSYAWSWGDSTADGTGAQATHTYAGAGTYSVTLTVTDNGGLTDTETHSVAVGSQAAAIAFRGSAGVSQRGVTTSTVTVPAAVQAGDALLLVWSGNSATLVPTTPAGWTLENTQASGNISTRVYSKVAAASDANSPVSVSTGTATAKVTLQVAAYSGTSTTDPVAVIAGRTDTGGTSHATPTATAGAGSWVVSLWSDKQSAARTWTPPASGLTVRSNLAGVGSGDVATLLGDTGPVAAGTVGGLTATVPTASSQATMFTVVLAHA
ncbi:MAG: PKD domain-containing protein [Blastococcus sp.]